MSTGKAPALYHMRTLARTSKVLDVDSSPACPSPPPFRSRSHVSVPFLWEDAPGKPKLRAARPSALPFPSASPAPALADAGATAGVAAAGGQEDGHGAHARPVLLKLKLPPRLQAAEHSLASPRTVLQGPYFGVGGNKPPRPLRRTGSAASCRRGGGGLFVWRKGTATATATASAGSKEGGHCQLYAVAVAPDASCCSPGASSASSSSSSSMSYFFDDHSRRQADGRDDSEDGEVADDGAKGTVRITRFRRNRSLPTMSRSHLWANIRKGVKQISPWSSKPT